MTDLEPEPRGGADPKRALAEYELAAHKEEYRDLAELWSALETKAQGSTAVSGIFLAALLVFLQSDVDRGFVTLIGISLGALSLISSVVFALLALRVRKIPAPVLGSGIVGLVSDLEAVSDPSEHRERFPRFLVDQSRRWRAVNSRLRRSTEGKACWLTCSQVALVVAVLSVGYVVAVLIFAGFSQLGGTG